MAEQLELFGEEGLSSSRESKAPTPEPAPVTEKTSSESPPKDSKPDDHRSHEIPEGYVEVRIGPDEELTKRGAEIAGRLGLTGLARQISVFWNRKMRTAAGRAFYETGRIELNPRLQTLPESDRTGEIERTFLHELAHLVSFARARGRRIRPHGPEWKQACSDVGIPGEDRCHDLDFQPRRQRRKFAYECPACGSVVKRVRRLKRRVACYACCRSHAKGRFDTRFVLDEKPIE